MGEGKLYSSVIAEEDMRNSDAEAWLEKAEEANPTEEGFGMRYVG